MKQSICQFFGVVVFAILGFVFSASPVFASWPGVQGLQPGETGTNGTLSFSFSETDGDGIGVRFTSSVSVPTFSHVNWYICNSSGTADADVVVVLNRVEGVFTLVPLATSTAVAMEDVPDCSDSLYENATSTTFTFSSSFPIVQDEEYFAYVTKVPGSGSVSSVKFYAYNYEQSTGMYSYVATTSGNYSSTGANWGGLTDTMLGFEWWTGSLRSSKSRPPFNVLPDGRYIFRRMIAMIDITQIRALMLKMCRDNDHNEK